MFVGEALCLIVYGIMRFQEKRNENSEQEEMLKSPGMASAEITGLKTDINVLLLAIPAIFDILASSLMFVALTRVAASVYQMMRGGIVVITAILSVLFLKRKQYRHHIFGILLILAGIVIVGVASVVFSKDDKKSDDGEESEGGGGTDALGIIMLIISQLFAGSLFIVEEKLLGNYYLHPLKVVGWEGIWGLTIYIILLIIFQQINCDMALCTHGKLEDTLFAFEQMGDNVVLVVLIVGGILSIAFFNFFGVSVTKNASAAQRSTIDTSRTAIIWIFFLIYKGDGHEEFIWLQLVGFIVLIFGTLIYNEILVLPCGGFDQWTKVAILKRQQSLDSDEAMLNKSARGGLNETQITANSYMASSPAHYDAQRNVRRIENKMSVRNSAARNSNMQMEGLS